MHEMFAGAEQGKDGAAQDHFGRAADPRGAGCPCTHKELPQQDQDTVVEIVFLYALTRLNDSKSGKAKPTVKNVICEQMAQVLRKTDGIDEKSMHPKLSEAAREQM